MSELMHACLQHTVDSPLSPVLTMVERIARSNANVLLAGEMGVGKAAVADRIHRHSARGDTPMVVVHCEGASKDALARALFGDDGDLTYRGGLFGAARGGTLLLDEVSELPPRLQGRLANALSMGAGDPSSARLIATTGHGLDELAALGRLRPEFVGLFPCSVALPPIRERPQDAIAIMQAAWTRVAGPGRELTSGVLDLVRGHDWPGNAREIEAFALQLSLLSSAPVVGRDAAELALRGAVHHARRTSSSPTFQAESVADAVLSVGLHAFLQGVEDSIIDWALTRAGGTRQAAADLLRVKRTTLVEKLRRRQDTPCGAGELAARDDPPRRARMLGVLG